MPKKQGVWREEWDLCSRCGFLHPLGLLTKQLGRLICTDGHGCLDDLSNQFRQKQIQEMLKDPSEGETDHKDLTGTTGELVFY